MSRSAKGSASSEIAVVPAALVVLVVLLIFALFNYRNTVSILVSERRMEAQRMAAALVREFEGRALPRDDELARHRAPARGVALLNAAGEPLVVSGELAAAVPRDFEDRDARKTFWQAVREPPGEVISGLARMRAGGRILSFQVDLPARALLAAERALRILVPITLAVSSALLLLVGLFLRRSLQPFDRLMRRARATGRLPEEGDELDFLLSSFEEAVERLAAPARHDLDALERTLTRSVESGLLLLDERGSVLALNEIGAELLGVEAVSGQPEGMALDELLEPHPEAARVLLEAVRERRGVERRELALGDGRRTLGLTLHPLRRDDGEVRGYLAFFVDLTAVRRQAEERQLSESLDRIGEVAAGVAHEMRNSLATLRGYLTLIERGRGGDDLSEYVEEIRRETDHIKRVVDDFLSFARPGSARMESVDLERLLHRAAADPALDAMTVRIEAGAAPCRVHGDDQLLERALRNLLHNAAQAERSAGRDGPLEVSLDVSGDEAEVVIRDRGPGIPEAIRSQLFHPFVSERAGGVGLGLALTHRILALHGGTVRLTDRDGGGAEARVRMPLKTGDDASVTEGNIPD